MVAGEDEFVRRRIYLTLERGRDIALRNLFRKVFVASGFEEPKEAGMDRVRRTRIPVREFVAAVRLGSTDGGIGVDEDEVECLLANLIYKVRRADTSPSSSVSVESSIPYNPHRVQNHG